MSASIRTKNHGDIRYSEEDEELPSASAAADAPADGGKSAVAPDGIYGRQISVTALLDREGEQRVMRAYHRQLELDHILNRYFYADLLAVKRCDSEEPKYSEKEIGIDFFHPAKGGGQRFHAATLKHAVPIRMQDVESDLVDLYAKEQAENSKKAKKCTKEIAGMLACKTSDVTLDAMRMIQKRGTEARHHMIVANLKLVESIANKFKRSASPEDLTQEGNLGLMRAVEGFDPSRGTKFSTYATHWITRAILTFLTRPEGTIRIPAHIQENIRLWDQAGLFLVEFGHSASDQHRAALLRLTPDAARNLQQARLFMKQALSAIFTRASHEDGRLMDIMAQVPDPRPSATPEDMETINLIMERLAQLPDKERQVIRAYYGLDGERSKTLEEIGEEKGLTRERIRQLREAAMERLRKACGVGARAMPSVPILRRSFPHRARAEVPRANDANDITDTLRAQFTAWRQSRVFGFNSKKHKKGGKAS